nr:hypothetical protein [Kofleriaceae bacterium]
MPSRLSSLLVRDGLVGVKRMEKAFQRQVIYGGSLDTILLEMQLVSEERLTQYLALASGLPPAARDEAASIVDAALAAIPKDLAEKHRAIPLATAGEAVRILVCSPLELDELEDLADILDRPLQPLITPEYRWHLAFATAYGGEAPARFTTLARSLDAESPATPVGRGAAVIVDERARRPMTNPPVGGTPAPPNPLAAVVAQAMAAAVPPAAPPTATSGSQPLPTTKAASTPVTGAPSAPISPIAPHEDTLRMSTTEVEAALGGVIVDPPSGRAHSATLLGHEPNRASTDSIPIIGPVVIPAPPIVAPTPTAQPRPAPAPSTPPRSGRASISNDPRRAMKPLAREEAIAESQNRDTPLPVVRARELLAVVDDRDTLFLTLLRAARTRARWAGLLTVQGGAAIGRVALAEQGLDIGSVASVLIPLDVVSPFRTVVNSQQPHIGPLGSGDAAIDAMLTRFGGTVPPSALILPVVLRDRVVALVVAHRVHNDTKLIDVSELLPLAGATSDALGRLIVQHKSAGRAPTVPPAAPPESAAPIAPIEGEHVQTKRIARDEASAQWRRPDGGRRVDDGRAEPVAAAASPIAQPPGEPLPRPGAPGAPEPSPAETIPNVASVPVAAAPTGEPARALDDILDDIETAKEGEADDAISACVERSSETLRALARRFPGELRVDRFTVSGRALRASQYGGLLEVVIQLGSIASELLIDKMVAPQRDVRFYATVCAAELRPKSAVYALVERVFDQDFGVRDMAIEALAGYPMQELSSAMARTRRAVHSDDPETVSAAARAIISLGDADAIPELIAVVEKSGRIGDATRKALVALTAQDFGASERKWRKWWDGARGRHRVEWLIDGLGHKDDAIREAAIADLRRLTGEYFGYHHDLPKREREVAATRWAAWWKDAGRRRFVLREDERHRPTALIPVRRGDD